MMCPQLLLSFAAIRSRHVFQAKKDSARTWNSESLRLAGLTPEDGFLKSSLRKEMGRSVLAMRVQFYLWAKRRCLVCRIHLASRTGEWRTSTVQPKAGRSENIYWLCKVSLLLPPSSLGLDGQEQPIRWFEDIQEVQKEPTFPCSSISFPCTASKLSSAKGHGKASLNWLLPSQGPSTSRDEEMLEAMVDESGCLTQICDLKRQLICSNSCRQRYCQANRGNKTRYSWGYRRRIWREI